MKRIRKAADGDGQTLRVGTRVLMPDGSRGFGPGLVPAHVAALNEDEDGICRVLAVDDDGREWHARAENVRAVVLDDPQPYFDRFDVCEAFWLLASHLHSGQWSRGYAVLSKLARINFNPRQSLRTVADLSENGQAIYRRNLRVARAQW